MHHSKYRAPPSCLTHPALYNTVFAFFIFPVFLAQAILHDFYDFDGNGPAFIVFLGYWLLKALYNTCLIYVFHLHVHSFIGPDHFWAINMFYCFFFKLAAIFLCYPLTPMEWPWRQIWFSLSCPRTCRTCSWSRGSNHWSSDHWRTCSASWVAGFSSSISVSILKLIFI